MFTWPSLEHWSDRVRQELNDAVVIADDKLGARGVYREIRRHQRPINVVEATFANGMSRDSESHVPMLGPFWHTLDMINNREVIHAISRQLDLLVAPNPHNQNMKNRTLFGAFATRSEEWVQTQKLVREIVEKEKRLSNLGARESVLKEIYEDFCESLSLVFTIEKAYLATHARTGIKSDDPWETRYRPLESCVFSKLEKLAVEGCPNGELSKRVIQNALNSKGPVQLSLPNFLKLMFIDTDRELAARFLESLGYGMSPQPKLAWRVEEGELFSIYAELESRQAGTAAKIKDALSKGKVTRAELDEIYEELVEEHQAQVQLVMAAGILKAPGHNLAQPS